MPGSRPGRGGVMRNPSRVRPQTLLMLRMGDVLDRAHVVPAEVRGLLWRMPTPAAAVEVALVGTRVARVGRLVG